MIDNIKKYFTLAIIALGGVLAALLGIESLRLKKAQAQLAVDKAEDKVQGLRNTIETQKQGASDAETELRRAEAEYNHHVRVLDEHSKSGSKG